MRQFKLWLILTISIFTILISNSWAIKTQRIASGLSNPLFLTSPAGDFQRQFVLEQNTAQIKIIKNGVVLATPFLDLNTKAGSGGEQGLLGLAFDPNYETNGFFFVNYTNNSGDTVVARYKVSGNPDIADPYSEFQLAVIDQPFGNHNGGMLAFSPNDGYLYLFLGDGGSVNDPGNRAQNPLNILGKIHRIDVSSGLSIPSDNPFVGDPAVFDSIWSLGVRNPWRVGFDRLNGDLYIGDVGQGAKEEISWQSGNSGGGENYGWRCMEGTSCTGLSGCACNDPSLSVPIHDYPHTQGNCSVIGGYVYRGSAIPSLDGTYFFADFCTGRIWSFRWDGNTVTDFQERTTELIPDVGSINNVSSFGEDAAGEIYIIDHGGDIFKIIPDNPPPTPSPTPTPQPASISLLELDPGLADMTNVAEARGATPNGDVTFIWGFQEGVANGNNICSGFEAGISSFNILSTVPADGNGVAIFNVFVPAGFEGLTVVLQAIDIASCRGSNVTNQTFTEQQPPPIKVSLDQLIPGQAGLQNNLTLSGATPNGDLRIIYGFEAGTDSADNICSGLQTGVLDPFTLSTISSDVNGDASFSFFIPAIFDGITAFLQAVDLTSCTPSNVIIEDL